MLHFSVNLQNIRLGELSAELEREIKIGVHNVATRGHEKVMENVMTGYRTLDWEPVKIEYYLRLLEKGFSSHDGLVGMKLTRYNLYKSIRVQPEGMSAVISTAKEYSIFLEKGTRTMPARPYFAPAFSYIFDDFVNTMEIITGRICLR